ncbi:MAG: hypothetical protein MUC71_08905 [Steroidobacteraceae bacterium]|jgi:hypothetical protein|nr:hypothetical protein [Steroidobacteraceae bacterium]
MHEERAEQVVEVPSLAEFFRTAVREAITRQQIQIDDHTEHYVVGVLTLFSRSEALYEQGPEGQRLKPLALMLADAAAAASGPERLHLTQRLGDVSLFTAGFFARGFARRLVDVDYHIAMGGRAYGSLADMLRGTARGRALSGVFRELAAKFQRLVDALNDIADSAHVHTDQDVMRLYETWLRTGSPRARELLLRLGVQPVAAGTRSDH